LNNQLSISLRPRKFSDIFNQPSVVTELSKRAKDKNWPQAMLFKGPSGIGKTTAALVVAMSINCPNIDKEGNPCCKCRSCLSIIEERFDRDTIVLDGSSFSGKDDMVSFGQATEAMPMYDKKKILIIEESDQLSTSAKNAMLKLLEKPREHVHFILLSMVNSGIPPAIQSRCQTYTFKPFTTRDVMLALKNIMDVSGVWDDASIPSTFKLQGVAAIASASRGSLREAIQYYEKCLVGQYFTKEDIQENLGLVDEDTIQELLAKLLNKDLTFFNDIFSLDINEFFGIGYAALADSLCYSIAGFTKNSYYEKPIAAMSTHPNLAALVKTFDNISENAKPYIPKAYFYSKIGEYYSVKNRLVESNMKMPENGKIARRVPL
jgi:DNA polymerase III subunit gamma/tau